MKLNRILLTLCIAFWGCNKDFKPFTTELVSIENNYAAEIDVTYDSFKGNEVTIAINESIENSIIKAIDMSSEANTLLLSLEAFNTEYASFVSDFPDTNQKWKLRVETEIIYQSENVITVAISTYQDKGGAHGNDAITLLNFNPKTGETLEVNSVIKDGSAFKKIAESYFYENVKNNSDTDNAQDYFFGKSFQLPENIGFNEDGVILLYNVYEIASYAQGYTEFVIPYEKVSDILAFN